MKEISIFLEIPINRKNMSIQKVSYIIILSLGLLPIASCQKKEVMPEFHVQI